MKGEEEARFSEELRLKTEKEDQASLKEEEETCLAEEFILKAKDGGLCVVVLER